MQTFKAVSVGAFFAVAVVLSAGAAPVTGQSGWGDHSAAYLGVQITSVTQERAASLKLKETFGAVIVYVDQDGPACRAGLMENDVVIGFNGVKVDNADQLTGMIHSAPPDKPVMLTIMRSGQQQNVKVTLGSWRPAPHVRAPGGSMAMFPPLPPRPYVPDAEIPSMTLLSTRHGLMVESLSPQLADFFGVPHGEGVLVRSVERGSPGAAAGLKAGDIILKVNNEVLHDISDWQRALQAPVSPKLSLGVWRDKHEQTILINVSHPGDTSKLRGEDWLNFDSEAKSLRDQMEQLRPEIEQKQQEMVAQLGPSQQELEQMQRDIEKSMKQQKRDMEKMARDMAKSAKPMAKDMNKMQRDLAKSLPSQKELDEMKQQFAANLPTQQQIEEWKRQALASAPTQQQMEDMRRQIEDSMKNWTPEFQQQMEQLQKQMEQHKLDFEQMMKGCSENCPL